MGGHAPLLVALVNLQPYAEYLGARPSLLQHREKECLQPAGSISEDEAAHESARGDGSGKNEAWDYET